VVLSILADPEELTGEALVRLILERLVLLKGDSGALRKFVNQLKILSFLRNLHEETVKTVRNMVISEEFVKAMQKDDAFVMGVEQGMEAGMEAGLEAGLEAGKLLHAVLGIRNMVKKGFESQVIAELLSVSEQFVLEISKQMEKEPAIVELLKAPRASVKSVAKKLSIAPQLVQVIKDSMK
jgi:hypothetical protein